MTMANAIKKWSERRQATRATLATNGFCDFIAFLLFAGFRLWVNARGKCGAADCFEVTGDGGPNHPSVFSADRVDLLNVNRLLLLKDQVLRDGRAREADVTAPYSSAALLNRRARNGRHVADRRCAGRKRRSRDEFAVP